MSWNIVSGKLSKIGADMGRRRKAEENAHTMLVGQIRHFAMPCASSLSEQASVQRRKSRELLQQPHMSKPRGMISADTPLISPKVTATKNIRSVLPMDRNSIAMKMAQLSAVRLGKSA